MSTKERHITGGFARAGVYAARTFVRICRCVARPSLCEPPPSQSRWDVVRNRRQHGTADNEVEN